MLSFWRPSSLNMARKGVVILKLACSVSADLKIYIKLKKLIHNEHKTCFRVDTRNNESNVCFGLFNLTQRQKSIKRFKVPSRTGSTFVYFGQARIGNGRVTVYNVVVVLIDSRTLQRIGSIFIQPPYNPTQLSPVSRRTMITWWVKCYSRWWYTLQIF